MEHFRQTSTVSRCIQTTRPASNTSIMFRNLAASLAALPRSLATTIQPCPVCGNQSFEGPRQIPVTIRDLRPDCPECSVIIEALWKLAPEILTSATPRRRFHMWRAKGRGHILLSDSLTEASFQIFTDPSVPIYFSSKPPYFTIRANSLHRTLGSCPFMDASVTRVAADALSPQCIKLASKWLNTCLSSHKACDPPPAAGCSILRKRLIDAGSETHDPRLVLPLDGSTGECVALSHCWGATNR